jgi:hypothetical protein
VFEIVEVVVALIAITASAFGVRSSIILLLFGVAFLASFLPNSV